jgi:hypothetical protein
MASITSSVRRTTPSSAVTMPLLFNTMVKQLCHRCKKPVYPTDKVGPLKDSTFFHQGCFKCYICGTRLALKTYCNNRNNIDDQVSCYKWHF